MPNSNTLRTRIQLKYDSLANWNNSTFAPLAGEVCIAIIPNAAGTTAVGDPVAGQLSPYAIGMKVGDGTNRFIDLPWIQAIAGDVYGWAKAAERPSATNINVTASNTIKTIQQAITDIESSIGGIVSSGISADALSAALQQLQEQLTGTTTEIFNSNPLTTDDPPVASYPTQIIRTLTQNGLTVTATSSALEEADLPSIHLNKISDLTFNTAYDQNNNKAATMADITNYVNDRLTKTMTFIGVSTTEIAEGLVEGKIYPTISGTVVSDLSVGDVVLWRAQRIVNEGTAEAETITSDLEFVWTGSTAGWELLGDEGSYAIRGSIKKSDLNSDLQTEIDGKLDATTAASTYVPKNGTDRLMTADEGTKLAGIAAGAQANVIESVSVNGTAVTITNKNVDVDIPLIGITKSTQYGNAGTVSTADATITNRKITLDEIAFTGDVKNLKQTDTILVFDCGSASITI